MLKFKLYRWIKMLAGYRSFVKMYESGHDRHMMFRFRGGAGFYDDRVQKFLDDGWEEEQLPNRDELILYFIAIFVLGCFCYVLWQLTRAAGHM